MYPKQTFGPYGYDAENGRVRSYINPNMVPSNMSSLQYGFSFDRFITVVPC